MDNTNPKRLSRVEIISMCENFNVTTKLTNNRLTKDAKQS